MKRIILILFACSLFTGIYLENKMGSYGVGLFQRNFPHGIQIDWKTTNSGARPSVHEPKSLVSITSGGSVISKSGENLKIEKVYGYAFHESENNLYVEVATNKEEIHYVSFYKNNKGVTEAVAVPKYLFENEMHKRIRDFKWVSLDNNDSLSSLFNVSRLVNWAFLIIFGVVLVLSKNKGTNNA